MDTGVVIIQEPVFTKTSVEEAHAGVVLDHSTMDVDKANLSTVLDDSSIQGEPEVAEGLNGSGDKETEESKHEKEEVMKTISVLEDSKIVKEKASETGTNEQGTAFVHEPKNTEDAKIIVTLEKEKEDETNQKPEEVSVEKSVTEEGQTETKHSKEHEKDISKASEEIQIKTGEVKDSKTVETSVDGTEDENNETVSVEEVTRNADNIGKETALEQETTTHDVETTERVLVEAEKYETETVNTVVKDPEIVNNEDTTVHDLKEKSDAAEAIKNSDEAEKVSCEVTGDKEKEVDIIIIHKAEEGEDIESKASKETEEHEHVLVRDIPQEETLVPKAETVNTSTVQESVILKTLETNIDETDAEPSFDLKEEEESVTPSDEVLMERPKLSPEQKSKDTEEDEHVLGRNMPQGEAESLVTKEDREQEDKEEQEKTEAEQVAGDQNMELNEIEAEETPVIKHPDVKSGEQMEKPSLETPSKVSVETRKTSDEKIQEEEEEEEEEEAPHQESKEKAQEERILDLAPLQEESCLPNEQDEDVKSDEVIQVSSASPEGETLFEAKKIEVTKANEEEEQAAADKIQSILETVDTEPVKSDEETTVHESISLKDDSDPVEAIKNSDDAEQVSHEVTGDREKEEDIIHKAQELQESLHGEDIELKASKETEEHEHVLVRDIPQDETLVPKAETVNTSTVQGSAEPSLGLKEKEETVKTVTPSDEVQESITLMEPPELSPEQRSKDTEQDEHVLGSSMLQGDIIMAESESLVTKENEEAIMDLKEEEKTEKLEEVPSDLALKVDKEDVMDEKKEVDAVAGGQNMERGLELNESEAELVDQNITDETEEKLVDKPTLESPSEVSEETSKNLDEKIQEKTEEEEEEVSPHQEGQERVSVPENSEVEEKSQEERSLDLPPLPEETKEKIHKHEQVKSDVSSASPEGETVFEAKKIKEIKANEEEEQVVADKIQTILETVETVDTELVKSNEEDIAESLNSAGGEIQIKSKDRENVQIDETDEVNEEKSAEASVNETEDEHNATVSVEVISKNNESTVHETASEEIKNSDEAEENSHEVTGDREKEEDIITPETTQELQERQNLLLQVENTESESSKDTKEHEHVLVRDVPKIDTLVTEVEDVNTSTVHRFESNEAEVGQETRKDIEPSFDLKEDKEKEETESVTSSDEVRPCDQVDDENLLEVPSGKLQPETLLVAKTESQDKTEDKTEVDDGTQVMGEHLAPNEPVAEQIDQTKTDEKSTTVGEKMEEEGSSAYGLEIKDETTLSVPEGKVEVSSLPKETTNDQQSPVEEKYDQVSSEEHEGGIVVVVVDALKLEDTTEEEQVAEKIKNRLEPLKPQSLLPSYSEEQERETVSEKIEDEKVKEEEPIVQILSEEDAMKSHVTEAEAKKGDEETGVRDTQQGEAIVNEADTSTVQEAVVGGQVTKEDTEPRLDLKEDKEQEETETVILSDEIKYTEMMQRPSLETPSEETSKTVDGKMEEKPEEEVTLHQKSEETVTVPESSGRGVQAKQEESCPPNEEKDETKEEDSTSAHQTTPVEEKSEQEAEKIEDLKENEKEPVEEEKLKQDKEILEEEEDAEVPSSETIPQETLSDVMAVQLKREVNAKTTESHEEEATVAQTRDIETSLTDKFSIDQEEESPSDEQEKVEEAGETQTRELEEEHIVHSSEKNDNETLIAETKKEDEEDKTENLEATQLQESSQEVSDAMEETKVEALTGQSLPVEASHAHQTPSSELDDRTPKQVEEIHQEETKAQEEEILPSESVSSESFSKTQEERHASAVIEETKPKETSDDQIETSTKVTKVEDDEDTKETDTHVAETPEDACLEQEAFPGAVMEDQDSDDFTFSKSVGESEHGDENSSTLPVVGILKELQTTLEEKEGGIIIKGDSSGNDLNSVNADEPETTLEKSLVVEETPASEIIQDSISRELQEEILIPSKQEEGDKQEDVNASTSDKIISLQVEEHTRDFEIDETFSPQVNNNNNNNNNNNQEDASEVGVGHDSATTPQVAKEQETHNVLGNDEEIVTSEKKIIEPLDVVAEKELNEEHVKSQAVSDDTKSINEMDFPSETSFEVTKVQEDKNEETVDALITSEKVQLQDQSKDFGQGKQSSDLKYVQEDLDDEVKDYGHDSVLEHKKDSDLIEEKREVDHVKTEPEDAIKYGVSTEEKNRCEKIGQEATKEIYQEDYKQTDTVTAIKEEIKEEEKETTEDSLNSMKNTDDEIKDYGLDSVVAQKKESGSMEEKKEVEKNNMSGKIGHEATKKIYEEECKQIDPVTAIKEDIKEEKKETQKSCLNSMKNTDDATEKTKPEIQEIEKLSPVSETQDKPPKQEDEVPTQQKREIADDAPKLENLKIAEEVHQKDGEDETEQIVKEPARKSLSDLIQKVKVTDNTEVATTEPRIEEEAKAEGEDEDGDEHKDDKTSPDSIVMVEAKDTVSIIKTHKKSQGLLSGVGSKVKHSISKVKKALTGKSSHTTKPSSPQ